MDKKSLYKSAGLVIFISAAAKILGFLRDASIAKAFGATYKTDAYTVAITIPAMLFSIIGDSVATAFIPILSESYKKHDNKDMFAFVNSILNILMLISFLFCIIGVLFTPKIVSIVAPKFSGESRLITVRLARISMFNIIFMSMTACYTALLQTMDNFTGPAMVGIAISLPIIVYTTAGSRYDVYGLVVFTLIGYVFQTVIQSPWLIKNKYKYSFKINWKDYRLKRFLHIIAPVIIGTGINQINVLVEKIMASGLPEGSIAALDYANKLNTMIYTTFALAVVTVVFPTLSREGMHKDYESFKEHLNRSINSINMIMIPSAVGMVVLRKLIVSVLFKRGAFDSKAVSVTSGILLYLSIAMVFYGIRDICNKAFYALQDTKTPMINGAIGVFVCICMNFAVVRYMGINGIAFSSTVSVIVCSILLMVKLKRKIGNINWKEIYYDSTNILLSSAVMGTIIYFLNNYIIRAIPGNKGELISLFCSIFMGVAFYTCMLIILNVRELKTVNNLVKEKTGGDLMKHGVKYIFICTLVMIMLLGSAIAYNSINKEKKSQPSVSKVNTEAPKIKNISITKRDSDTYNVEVNIDGGESKKLLYQIWVQAYDGWSLIRKYDSASSCLWNPKSDIKKYYRVQAKIKDGETGTLYDQKIQEISYKELGILKISSIVTDSPVEGHWEIGKPINITAYAEGAKDIMYQYFVTKGDTWEKLSDYSDSSSFTWIPKRGGNCRLLVKVKDKSGYQCDQMSVPFEITGDLYNIPELKNVSIEYAGKGKTLRIKGESVAKSKDERYMFSIGESLRNPKFIQDYSSKSECFWNADKSGIYQITTYVKNKDSLEYEDGIVKEYHVTSSNVKNVKLDSIELSESNLTQPVGSTIKFTAKASGGNKLLYAFWRLEASGHRLIQDYSEKNNFTWTPERPGVYTILVRVKDTYSGSYEDEKSVTYTIVDSTAPNVNIKDLTVTGNLKKRVSQTIEAETLGSESLMYKFFVTSDFLGCEIIQDFSTSNSCRWTPRKAGNYKIEVWVKDVNSDSYDARMIKEININN